jgi:hypothetical protein
MSYIDVKEVYIKDVDGNIINVTQDETVQLLRRMVKILEPIGTQDSLQRQRVVIENSSVNISSYGSVDPRFQIADWARTAYNTGIRANII